MAKPVSLRGNINKVPNLKELNLIQQFGEGIQSASPLEYAKAGFSQEAGYYRDIVQKNNYVNQGRVIDLAGGFGRWSVFLAEVNDYVLCLDHHPGLIELCRRLAHYLEFDNIEGRVGSVMDLPVEDASFNAAWLHGAIFLVERGKTMKEIARVLVPGGRLYMGACNGPGKMLQKLCRGYLEGGYDHHLCKQAIAAFEHGPLFDGQPNYVTGDLLEEIMKRYGFTVEREYPVEDYRKNQLSPSEQKMLADHPSILTRFKADEGFRKFLLENYKRLMLGMEFDFWFSARKIK